MQKKFMTLLSAALLLTVASGATAQEIIARVGNVPVTIYEFNREVQKEIPLNYSFHKGVSQETQRKITKKAMDIVLERAYKVQYAIDHEISVPAEKLQAKFAQIDAKYPDREEFLAISGGETMEEFRASVYRDLLASTAERKYVDDKVTVDEAEVEEYYEENKERFFKPMTFKASHILIKVDPSANAEMRKERLQRAEELLERAKAGEDFYNLAYYESDDQTKYVGGSLGTFHEGEVDEAFEKELRKLEPGEISGLVQSLYGYHIILLQDKEAPRQMSFDETRDMIRGQLLKNKRQERYDAWMQELESQYKVELYKE